LIKDSHLSNPMQNKILAQIDCGSPASTGQYWLDTAAELSKIQRLNNHQVDAKGRALVYDILVTATPQLSTKIEVGPGEAYATQEMDQVNIQTETVPLTWQTRNAVKMTHASREDLRRASGVSKKSIGKYAKTLRMNMDSTMFNIPYAPAVSGGAASERIYAHDSILPTPFVYTGGVWDYSQLTQVEYDAAVGPETQADAFFVNVCGAHQVPAPGPYTYAGALQGYNQRRQTVFDSATATAGGDTQFIVDDSPFFRIVDKDIAEDEYTKITLDEQDNPPYDRTAGGTSDSMIPSIVDVARFSNQNGLTSQSWRVQAPLGLLKLKIDNKIVDTLIDFEFEVMATYPME
jgi:hypothetical protein